MDAISHGFPTMSRYFTSNSDPEDTMVAMLSPPLSPYPKQAAVVSPVLHHNHVVSSTVVTVDSPPPRPSSSASTGPDPVKVVTPRVVVSSPASVRNPYKVTKHDPKSPLVTNAWTALKADPVNYFMRERAYLDMYPMRGPTWSNYVSTEPTINLPATLLMRGSGKRPGSRAAARRRAAAYSSDNDSDTSSMVTRRAAAAAASGNSSSRFASSDIPTRRPAVRVPRSSNGSRSSTPNRRAGGSSPAPPRVHDLDVTQLTDYSPSTADLPQGKSLKAEWKGAPMDLSDDPNVGLLHPAEVHLASVLRLPADVYLDSKRRLFAEKVQRLRQGLQFRRTDAQKACRIDVNKASRLFGAFEKVGWLKDSLFDKHL